MLWLIARPRASRAKIKMAMSDIKRFIMAFASFVFSWFP
jgi:hypothetical protein